MSNRDKFGRVVREAWVRWAKTQPDPKPTWLVSYDELSEPDKEADRQIAEAVLAYLNERRIDLAEKASLGELTPGEAAEFSGLQESVFSALDVKFPHPALILDRLDAIEARLEAAERKGGPP